MSGPEASAWCSPGPGGLGWNHPALLTSRFVWTFGPKRKEAGGQRDTPRVGSCRGRLHPARLAHSSKRRPGPAGPQAGSQLGSGGVGQRLPLQYLDCKGQGLCHLQERSIPCVGISPRPQGLPPSSSCVVSCGQQQAWLALDPCTPGHPDQRSCCRCKMHMAFTAEEPRGGAFFLAHRRQASAPTFLSSSPGMQKRRAPASVSSAWTGKAPPTQTTSGPELPLKFGVHIP